MRIRKRFQNPLPPPDLPSPLPPSLGPAVAAAAAAPPVAAERGAAVGVKEGEAVVAAAAALRSGGDRCGGGGGGKGGFHPNGLAASPTPCLPPFQPPSGAAAAEGGEGGVPAPKPGLRLPSERGALLDYGLDKEVTVPKRDAGDVKEIGDALSRNGSANLVASRSLGAEASEASSPGPGHTAPPPVMAERAVPAGWRKEERNELFPLVKRRAAGRHARGRNLGLAEEGEEEDVVAERDVKPTPPGMSRRRRGAAFGTKSTMAAAAGTGAAGATRRCDDTSSAKEEGAECVVSSSAATTTAEGSNVGVGGVKKRRSPAVLMEGSRCSRVNGRGWRCCQQTLVGYSLCEHHLGKGRLRSVSSVRTRKEEDVVGGDHAPAGGGNKRRRNNVGTVKARSLSSLLHQADHHHHPSSTVVAIAAPPQPIPSPSPTPAARPASTAAAPPPRATDTVVA